MVDANIISDRLSALEGYIARLESKRSLTSAQMLAEWEQYYAIQHMFQLAAQVVIDITSHIVTAEFPRRLTDYHSTIWF